MSQRISIRSVEPLSENWIRLTRTTLDYQRRDGSWQTLTREVHDHGNAAAVLPHDPVRDTVLLVRQFRLPAWMNGHAGWLIEVIAGLLDGDDPETCARREAAEETGYALTNLRPALTAFTSPGAVTEFTHLFLADYSGEGRIADGGGLVHEGEDIEVLELDFEAACAMIGSGEIVDAKTIMLLQYLALQRR